MLVAVALVVLMMTLFATIFQMATGAMATQKGLTENDQRVRLVLTMMRNDLGSTDNDPVTGTKIKAHRTFKLLIPYAAKESATNPPWNAYATPPAASTASDRSGYFYISEGNINDETDDVIQWTVTIPPSSNDRFFGRAAVLFADAGGNYGPAGTTPPKWTSTPSAPYPGPYPPAGAAPLVFPPTAGFYWPDQPEFDDQLGTPNQVASSTNAEVCYFLRNGTLYRRVMLLRTPNVTPVSNTYDPQDTLGNALVLTPYTSGTRNFFTDFDYSVSYNPATTLPRFHGVLPSSPAFPNDLSDTTAPLGLLTPTCLQFPYNRWGFDNTTNVSAAGVAAGGGGYGLPKEYVGTTFIGRYTHAETSDPAFGYPALVTGPAGNPMSNINAGLNYDTATGRVQYKPGASFVDFNGPRVGEDVLMTNVIAFDIKVWDPAASLGPDGKPGIGGWDDDGINGIDDNGEIGAYGSDDGDWRDIGHPGMVLGAGVYGFYRAQPFATNPNFYYSNSASSPPGNRFDTWGPAIEMDGSLAALDNPPFRPFYAGPDGRPGVAGKDDDGNGIIDDASELGWAGGATGLFPAGPNDDYAPLTAIKITIRFYDTTSKQVRDVSNVFSLIFEN